MREKGEHIIDPPVGPYSPTNEIRAWILELEQMTETENVRLSLLEAKEWLRRSQGQRNG